MIVRRFQLAAAVLAVGLALPAVGAAEDRPTKQEIQAFRTAVASGVKHFKAGEHEKALEAFERAQKIANPPSLQYKIGRSHQALGNCQKAREIFEAYTSHEISEKKRAKGEKRLRELKANCNQPGVLRIDCKPEGAPATVQVADRSRKCPAAFDLPEGSHEVAVRADGYRTARGTVDVEQGSKTTQTVHLQPVEREPTTASDSSTGSGSRRVVQIGSLVVGAGLVAAGVGTDLTVARRLREMEEAKADGDREQLQTLREQGRRATTRAAIFYVAGGVLAVGGGAWLTIDVAGSNEEGRARLGITLRSNGIAGVIRW